MVFPVIIVAKVLYLKKRQMSAHPVKKAMPVARRVFPSDLALINKRVLLRCFLVVVVIVVLVLNSQEGGSDGELVWHEGSWTTSRGIDVNDRLNPTEQLPGTTRLVASGVNDRKIKKRRASLNLDSMAVLLL